MSEITIRKAQQIVDEWIKYSGTHYWEPLSNLARMTEEMGELARVVNDAYGEKKKRPEELQQDIGIEMCDLLFAMICLANSLNIDLQDLFTIVIDKYNARDVDRWKD